MGQFRWGILGTGMVARKFRLGLGPGAMVTGVASRSRANADRFARELDVDQAFDTPEALIASGIDALYVATPPSMHEAHALLSIAAGVPVLIEKPFALDASAARRIVEAAQAAGVFCMEGMWTRFLPLATALRTRIEAGEIGAPRAFAASFMTASVPDPTASLFDPGQGGGALMHRGIYPLSLARFFLGPIEETISMARIGDTGVDEDCTLTCRHASGALSTLRASLRTDDTNAMTIQGTEGALHIEAPVYRPFRAHLMPVTPKAANARGGGRLESVKEGQLAQGAQQRLSPLVRSLRGRGGRSLFHPYTGNGYGHEAAAVQSALSEGLTEHPLMPLSESIELMTVIDEARAAWTPATSTSGGRT